MNSPVKNSGYFSIVITVILTLISILAISLAALYMSSMRGATDRLQSMQAFGIAEAGLERAVFALLSPHVTSTDALTKRYSCASATFSNQALGAGVFTVTNSGSHDTVSFLSTAITSSAVIIPVTTLSGLASEGRILIDQESIDFSGTSTSIGICGVQPCLTGIVRGRDATTAASHVSGTPVAHYQCTGVQSVGGVPNLTSPIGQRTVKRGGVQMQKAWAVGDDIVGDEDRGELTTLWNGTAWVRLGPSASIPNVDINGIDMLSYGDGWAVGDPASANALFLRWDGTQWNRVIASSVPSVILNSVYCVIGSDCWAVGVTSGGGEVIDHWDGTTWTRFGPYGTVPNVVLNDIYCVSTNDCWTVGAKTGGKGTIAHWTGSTWTTSGFTNSAPNESLNSVVCVSSSDCWTVGTSGKIVRFNGSTWSQYTDIGGDDLSSVYCVDANDCWAVGEDGAFVHWNGSTWSLVSVPAIPEENYYGVACYTGQDCWAVGQEGVFVHWDGSNWTQVTSPIPDGENVILRAIDTVGSKGGSPASIWQEDFH